MDKNNIAFRPSYTSRRTSHSVTNNMAWIRSTGLFAVLTIAILLTGCDSSLVDSGTTPSSATLTEMQHSGHTPVEVVVDKNVGFVLNGLCGVPIPEIRSTVQTKNGDIHLWTVLYQAPEGCTDVPDKGVVRLSVGFAGNTGTLTINPSGRIISKFVSDRGF